MAVVCAHACAASIALKRRLGFAARLEGVPRERTLSMMAKPVLVIGNCTLGEIKAIRSGRGQWEPLLAGLKKEASGLILLPKTEKRGCHLDLKASPRSLVFDAEC